MKRQRTEQKELLTGVASSKGRKHAQEDVPLLAHHIGDGGRSFYAVLDGHGGRNCAEWTAEHLPHILTSQLTGARSSTEIKEAIKQAFLACDEELLNHCNAHGWSDGCCVVGVLVDRQCMPARVYCANLGDSRACELNRFRLLRACVSSSSTRES